MLLNDFFGQKLLPKAILKTETCHKHSRYHKLSNKGWMASISAVVAEFTRDKKRHFCFIYIYLYMMMIYDMI